MESVGPRQGWAWPEVTAGLLGQPWAPCHGPCPQAVSQPHSLARGHASLSARGGQLFIFLAVKGGGERGRGPRELTLLVLTLAQAPREPLRGRGASGTGCWGRVWGGDLPATLRGQLAKANSTGQFLERDVGVSEVGKELATLRS